MGKQASLDSRLFSNGPTEAQIDQFIANVQAMVDAYYRERQLRPAPHRIERDTKGAVKRYLRISSVRYNDDGTPDKYGTSVYCFIDVTNGDLLKGSYKSPVPNGVRGNLFDPDHMAAFDSYGPKYLR